MQGRMFTVGKKALCRATQSFLEVTGARDVSIAVLARDRETNGLAPFCVCSILCLFCDWTDASVGVVWLELHERSGTARLTAPAARQTPGAEGSSSSTFRELRGTLRDAATAR